MYFTLWKRNAEYYILVDKQMDSRKKYINFQNNNYIPMLPTNWTVTNYDG